MKLHMKSPGITVCDVLSVAMTCAGDEASWKLMTTPLLPRLTEVLPGVHAAGFAQKYRSANCGWIAMSDRRMLVDLPRDINPEAFLNEVNRVFGTTPYMLVLTSLHCGDAGIVKLLEQTWSEADTDESRNSTSVSGRRNDRRSGRSRNRDNNGPWRRAGYH